jgi:nitrite reductase/ring-hydroxylating ferredoxin subunit/uncharacterized membrane protein
MEHTNGHVQGFSPGTSEVEQAIRSIPGYEELAVNIARSIHEAVLNGGDPTRAVADLLHGVWLGHSLHGALVTVPIGSWVAAAGFDIYAAMSGSHEAEWAADKLIGLGILGAVAAATAGIADYSAIKKQAAPIALTHAALNSVSLAFFLGSLWARGQHNRQLGVALSLLGLAVNGASAVIGGDLTYRWRVAVNHAPDADAPKEWTDVLASDDLVIGQPQRVEVAGFPVLLYRDGEHVHAISAVCSHAGGPLEQGQFENHCVTCPWHQSVFDLRDGRVVHGPATHAQPAYQARVTGDRVQVRLWRSETLEPEHGRENLRERAGIS